MSSNIQWIPDQHSNACMRCGALFGRVLGASRHHCRACGELICQTCKVDAIKEIHVIKSNEFYEGYLSMESKFKILERPQAASLMGNIYHSFSMNDLCKFCHVCNEKIKKEHDAFRHATYLLHAIALFDIEKQSKFILIAIRAYLANYEYMTGLALLGQRFYTRMIESFYKTKVRTHLIDDDELVNSIISSFYLNFFSEHVNKNIESYANTDLLLKNTNAYSLHVFINCLMNAHHVPDIRITTLRYLLHNSYQAMHILLSNVINYKVNLFPLFLTQTWNSILANDSIEFLLNYTCLFNRLITNTHNDQKSKTFMNQVYKLPNRYKNMGKVLCHCTTANMLEDACNILNLDYHNVSNSMTTLYNKLLSIVVGAEQYESRINIPWTSPNTNVLNKLKNFHVIPNMIKKIFSQEPKVLVVDHIISNKTNHVARLFQAWHVFAESNFVYHNVMELVFNLTQIVHPLEKETCVLNNTKNYIFSLSQEHDEELNFNSKPVLIVTPSTLFNTRIVQINEETCANDIEMTVNVLVTVLMMMFIHDFIKLDINESLNLVEVAVTNRNTQIIQSCLTYTGLVAIRKHILQKSLHAHTVVCITSIINKLVENHLDKLYIAMISLITAKIDHQSIVECLNSLKNHVKNKTVLSIILKHLV